MSEELQAWLSAERWSRSAPTPTLQWVVTEARQFSDPERVIAAEVELTRRAAPKRTEER